MALTYRIDRFELPVEARAELLAAVRHTHDLLRTVDGFDHDLLVEEDAGNGRLHLLTLAAWHSTAAMAIARDVVAADRAVTGFDPAALLDRLGVEPQFGTYRPVSGG